jgi:hypothetical protein
MKIPTDTISQPLLKPLDADAASAALDGGRLGLDHLPAAGALPEAEPPRSEAAVADRDAGEALLAADVWNDAGGSARLLPLSSMPGTVGDRSAALDQAVDAILAGLR